ncbi:hypothetical protein TRIP_C20177 [Candidatus Zixiibacteriota bacterium]|nr:hypothetical protein TRIP_C20177 [candidate division Zixibacteria bacterium]
MNKLGLKVRPTPIFVCIPDDFYVYGGPKPEWSIAVTKADSVFRLNTSEVSKYKRRTARMDNLLIVEYYPQYEPDSGVIREFSFHIRMSLKDNSVIGAYWGS